MRDECDCTCVCRVSRVVPAAVALLLLNYGGAIWMAFQPHLGFNTPIMAGVHSLLAAALIWRAFALHKLNYSKEAIIDFYRWIWNLFYCEYAIFPFI